MTAHDPHRSTLDQLRAAHDLLAEYITEVEELTAAGEPLSPWLVEAERVSRRLIDNAPPF